MDGINYFLPAQVWSYKTQSGANATLTILKIEELENDAIIHIKINDTGIPGSIDIEHLPISSDALMASVDNFIGHLDAVPYFESGYQQWKQAFDARKASYWKIPVDEVVHMIHKMTSNNK